MNIGDKVKLTKDVRPLKVGHIGVILAFHGGFAVVRFEGVKNTGKMELNEIELAGE